MKKNLKKGSRIFLDMDGSLFKFYEDPEWPEKMYSGSFYENLNPYTGFIEAIKFLEGCGREVYILSACLNEESIAGKNTSIDKHLSFIDEKHRLFIPYGANKTDYIPSGVNAKDVLFDDYNRNLEQWQEAGGTAIKCKNEINHKGKIGPLWTGAIVDITKNKMCILAQLYSLNLPFQEVV